MSNKFNKLLKKNNRFDYNNNSSHMLTQLDPKKNGSLIKLNTKYSLWCHDIYNKDWTLKGYKKIYMFDNVSKFWGLFNNFHKLGMRFNHYFIMKNDIKPIWEDILNRNGGTCSFKLELNDALKLWDDFNIKMITGKLIDKMDDINGISFSPRKNFALVRIWNADGKHDISKYFNNILPQTYNNISIQFKPNTPEY